MCNINFVATVVIIPSCIIGLQGWKGSRKNKIHNPMSPTTQTTVFSKINDYIASYPLVSFFIHK